jgi:hypothetical protein
MMAIRKPKAAAHEPRNRDTGDREGRRKIAAARIEAGGRLALPDWALATMRLGDGSEVQLELSMDGLTVRPIEEGRDPEQWWFWTDSWQEGEREVEAEFRGGRRRVTRSSEELMRVLGELEGGAQ